MVVIPLHTPEYFSLWFCGVSVVVGLHGVTSPLAEIPPWYA